MTKFIIVSTTTGSNGQTKTLRLESGSVLVADDMERLIQQGAEFYTRGAEGEGLTRVIVSATGGSPNEYYLRTVPNQDKSDNIDSLPKG